jgi:hypothetical protein
MKLIVQELDPSVYQRVTPTKNTQLIYIRPHLYIHNNPSGNIKLEVRTDDNVKIAQSDTLSFSDITSAIEFHGYVKFTINVNLMGGQTYRVYIIGTSGYSFNESAYAGVCNDYDLRKYPLENPINHNLFAPLDIEFWEYTKK